MNYRNPQLGELLAGEYVLGTLRGGARRRLERLLETEPELRDRVIGWQVRLQPLSDTLPALAPGEHVWQGIVQRLGLELEPPPPAAEPWRRLALWRGVSFAAIALSVVLATVLLISSLTPPPSPAGATVAVINDADARPLWLLRLDPAGQRLHVQVLRQAGLAAGKVHELWLLPGAGATPVSLGLLPHSDDAVLTLRDPPRLFAAAGLAVSLEPAGGSPTGTPTGPVLYQAAVHRP